MEKFILNSFNSYKSIKGEFYITKDDWLNLSESESQSIFNTFELFATQLAKLYDQNKLNYEFCDSVINDAWSEWMFSFLDENKDEVKIPPDFYEVYEAFDAGEYYRREDKSDDPIAEHTNPLIRKFLDKISNKPTD